MVLKQNRIRHCYEDSHVHKPSCTVRRYEEGIAHRADLPGPLHDPQVAES